MKARTAKLSYRDSGVDIKAADRLVAKIAKLAASTRGPEVLSGVGPFAAAVRLPRGYSEPVLLSSSDGVGTKLALARLAGRHDSIGIDLVAMNVNDLITAGARPLFFLDYLAVGQLSSVDCEAIIAGIAQGCRQSATSLVGGETAEMPGFYRKGEYDLAGFCVGVGEKKKLINGRRIRPGNVIVGLHSSGLHSNGYSLARKALRINGPRSLASKLPGSTTSLEEELLRPTTIYVKPVLAALENFDVRGMAHITGGGIPGNLVRALPQGIRAVIDRSSLPNLPIFDYIERKGHIDRKEMDATFNCGIGYTMVVPATQATALCRFMRRRRVKASAIGHVESGRRRVRYE